MSGAHLRAASLAAVCTLLAGCNDGLIHQAAPPAPASLAIVASIHEGAGGSAEAYDRVDQIQVRFRKGDDLRLERQLAFDPSGSETRVAVSVPLREQSEILSLELELRMGAQPLFSGTGEVQLASGRNTSVDLDLNAVVAGVACAGDVVDLSFYGDVVVLNASAHFASGDVIDDAVIQWSTAEGTVVSIEPQGAQSARVTALGDGTASVVCAAGGHTDTRTVRVFAVVQSVAVTPAQASVLVGGTAAFTATLRDARQNVITGRPVTWTAGTPSVASVATNGVATGLAAGTSTINATSAGVTGSATLIVTAPTPPTAVTGAASNVTGAGAVLNGTVNPNGSATSGWFEWGTSSSLATFSSTATQAVGSGSTAVPVAATLGSLSPNVTYFFRQAASNAGGTVRGPIRSFVTRAPPTVTTSGATVSGRIASLQGQVNPNGAATQAWFEWGTSPTLASFAETAPQSMGSGTATLTFTDGIGNLQFGTTYYVRAAATSSGGTARGSIVSFTTPSPSAPDVRMISAAWIPDSDAQLRMTGGVTPNGAPTIAWFEWSEFADFRQLDSGERTSVGDGFSEVEITASAFMSCTIRFVRAAAASTFGTRWSEPVDVGQFPDCGRVVGRPRSQTPPADVQPAGTAEPGARQRRP